MKAELTVSLLTNRDRRGFYSALITLSPNFQVLELSDIQQSVNCYIAPTITGITVPLQTAPKTSLYIGQVGCLCLAYVSLDNFNMVPKDVLLDHTIILQPVLLDFCLKAPPAVTHCVSIIWVNNIV